MGKSNGEYATVVLEWIDVGKLINDDAFNDADPLAERTCKMTTVGCVYQEDDEILLLVNEFYEDKPRDWTAIPKALIKKRTVLKR